jgi:hypothetical protein
MATSVRFVLPDGREVETNHTITPHRGDAVWVFGNQYHAASVEWSPLPTPTSDPYVLVYLSPGECKR